MRLRIALLPLILGATLIAGCATTPADRISREPEVFAQFPAELQERIKAGRVEVGDPAAAVRLALGEPTQRMNRRSADRESEVWIYGRQLGEPRLRFSVGIGTSGAHSGIGGGVGISSGGRHDSSEEAMRVEFVEGRVVQIESRRE